MQPKFTSKVSKYVVGFFMAAIIISFILTGFQGFLGSPDSVAKVDGHSVSMREYQGLLQAELDRFSQIFGGKPLTNQQIRQFRIKENVINQLVQKALLVNLADKMNMTPGSEEVKATIKELPYFQTQGKFDVSRYKGLLQANSLTPTGFEESIKNDLKFQKISETLQNIYISDNYAKDILKIKNQTANVVAVQFERESLVPFIEVSKEQVSTFLADEKNMALLKSLFSSIESDYNKPEEVKARHILLRVQNDKEANQVLQKIKDIRKKVTTKNFASIAGKETQDPSGKSNGGDLGWFSKGRMVAEFENVAFSLKPGQISEPVKTDFGYHIIYVENKKKAITKTLEDVKEDVAKKHLQKSDRKALEALAESLSKEISENLEKGNTSKVESLAKKYSMKFNKDAKISLYETKVNEIDFKNAKLVEAFDKKSQEVISLKELPYYKFLKINSYTQDKEISDNINKNLAEEKKTIEADVASGFQFALVKELEEKSSIVTYPDML